jgi:aspartate/glutamate racemase
MTTYTITLLTTDTDNIRDLRRILKVLLRRYQLRCISVEEQQRNSTNHRLTAGICGGRIKRGSRKALWAQRSRCLR